MEDIFEKDENIYGIFSKEKCGLSIGKELYMPANKRGNTNCLVVAGSGAGKAAAYTKTNILNMIGSYIVTDLWGEIYADTYKILEEKGYKIITINGKNSNYNYGYNPINFINNDRDINILAEILIGDGDSDDFWEESCKCLIKAILYYVIENEEKKDLLTCFKLMSLPRNELFNKFETFDKNSMGEKYYLMLKTYPDKTYMSVVSTTIMKLAFVINYIPENREITEKFDFSEIGKNKTIVYLIDNEENKAEKKMINIFIAQYLSQIKYGEKSSVYLFLDGIDKYGKIYELPRNIENARARKMSISILTNNLNKLKSIYKDEFYTIINSIDTQILLGTNLKSDIDYFSEISGIDDKYIKNELKRDELLVVEKGLKPILASKDYFFEHEEWVNE